MAYTLRDYLVRISAQVDGIDDSVKALRENNGIVKSGAESADYAARQTSALSKELKAAAASVSRTAKTFARSLLGYTSITALALQGARQIKQLVSQTVVLEDGAEEAAKKSNKSLEKYRAEQIALQAMGKTLDEINKSAALKQTYDELVKYGEDLRFKKAGSDLTSIKDIQNAFTELKFVGRLVLAQTYEYFKTYVSAPLKQAREWFRQLLEKEGKRFSDLPRLIGKAAANALTDIMSFGKAAYNVGSFLITAIKEVIGMFREATPEIKLAFVAIAAVLGFMMGIFKPITMVITTFLLLIDDLATWKQGGQSFLGDIWITIVALWERAANVFKGVAKSFKVIMEASKEWKELAMWRATEKVVSKIGGPAAKALFKLVDTMTMVVLNERADPGRGWLSQWQLSLAKQKNEDGAHKWWAEYLNNTIKNNYQIISGEAKTIPVDDNIKATETVDINLYRQATINVNTSDAKSAGQSIKSKINSVAMDIGLEILSWFS